MKPGVLPWGVAALLAGAAHAQGEAIYKCVDAEGRATFTNVAPGKDCRRLDIGPITTVPAPKLPARPAAGSGERVQPASFPRIDADAQRVRDVERRRILEEELRLEEERLARLRAEFNNGEPERRADERNYARYLERVQRLQEEIQRGENNIAALRRELSLLRP
ncbi:MAG: DUF4124 domain-containing protein [Sutterellaceae bacterium]|nr:DUF4124 domain-containing protein [Burkholderiaceae bacterium]MDW8430466.1 DUF4124 domain-containing protein [Sutterellaceae bacterium]